MFFVVTKDRAEQVVRRACGEEVFGHADWLSPEGDLRSLPCHLAELGGMDGFYACRLRRL